MAGREGTETFIQSVNATWKLSDAVELQSITTYQDTDYVRIEDFDVTPAPLADLDRQGADEVWSQEARLKYASDRFSGVLGFYFFDDEEAFTDEFTVPGAFVNPAIPASLFVTRVSDNTVARPIMPDSLTVISSSATPSICSSAYGTITRKLRTPPSPIPG